MNILVSACLLGINCKYSGGNNFAESIIKLKDIYNIIPICPEQLGGLKTPRNPCEIIEVNDDFNVIDKCGNDFTNEFRKGAKECLKIAKMFNCKIAILKERSPSCGVAEVYDGTFKGNVVTGQGLTTKILLQNGIKVYNENNLDLIKD